LTGLWAIPACRDAQQLIQDNLDGWFRYRALVVPTPATPRCAGYAQAAEQEAAEQALLKLTLIGIPALGVWLV